MSGLLLFGYSQPARAGLIWDNGIPASITTSCNSSPDVCNGPVGNTGWTIFDDFTLEQDTTIASLRYDSYFQVGGVSDYISTNWSIWEVDPLNVLGFPPLFTGNAVARVATDTRGAVTVSSFTLADLNVDLVDATTYWFGYSNVLQNDGAKTLAVLSNDTTDLPGYEQGSNDGTVGFDKLGNTVFSVEPIPEPTTWMLLAGAMGCIFARRMRTRLVQE
jgi:hypothetical protein